MTNLVVKNTEEHLNYKCALVALSVTGKALENFTEVKLQHVHDTVSKKLGVLQPCTQQCSSKYRSVNKWCPTCDSWRKEIQTYVSGNNVNISWEKMKSWTWPVHHRNIAEVFVAPGWNTLNLNLKDVSTVLSIWQRCTEFPRHIVQFSKSLQKARNNLFHVHSSELVLTASEMAALFLAVYKVVNYGYIIPFIKDHSEVVKEINKLEKGDLHGHEADASKALNEIAGTNKKILAKLDNFNSDLERLERRETMNRFLIFFIPTLLSCLVYICIYLSNGKSTLEDFWRGDGLMTDAKVETRRCLPEKPHRLFKPGINMERYLVRDSTFIGRRWLFDALQDKTSNVSTKRGVVMVAEMGYGKSAIITHMVCATKSDVSYRLRKRLVAYHICRFDVQLSKRSNTFIKRLSSMIAQRFSTFARVLENDKACLENYDSDTCEQDPFGCMDQCLVDPLSKTKFSQNEKNIIVIDALDECEDKNGKNIIFDLLDSDRIKQLPQVFQFIITSRNVSAHYALDTEFSFMILEDNDDRNMQDIQSFIRTLEIPEETIERIGSLQNISNFLLISNILKNRNSLENGNPLPKSLYKYYGQQFKRLFGDQYDQPKSVLEILCAALSPPTEDLLVNITLHTTNISTEQFAAFAEKFKHILRFVGTDLHLSHMSLKMWLITETSGFYRLDIERGHMRHALYLFDNLDQNKTVDMVDIAIHISLASSRGKLMGMFHRLHPSTLEKSKHEDFPLHRLAKRCDCDTAMELLFHHFRDVNEVDQAGMSPLYIAASLGRTLTFQFLIKHNADFNFRLKSYSNVIHLGLAARIAFEDRHWGYGIMDIAAQNNHIDIINNILLTDNIVTKYHFYKMNGLNLLPIHLACKLGHINVVMAIEEHIRGMLDYWCFYYASENGNTDIVKFAIGHGIVDACRTCPENIYWVPENKARVQGNKILFEDGYSLHDYILFDDWNLIMCETALHAAIRRNMISVAQILISEPINALDCIDRAGRTPLISAVVNDGHDIVAEIVERYGFDTNVTCKLNVIECNYLISSTVIILRCFYFFMA